MRLPMLTLLAVLAAAAPAGAAERLLAVTDDSRLVTIHSDSPGALRASVAIKGLQAGERVVGLDVRPATGQLYGVTSAGRLFTLDPVSGAISAVGGPLNPALNGTSFGFDFNPTVDRIRLSSNGEQNLRLNPENGAVAATDKPLVYGPMDGGNGTNPDIVGAGYTNSVKGATMTTLYNLDAARDVLVTQNPPNDGVLNTVGPLGLDIDGVGGFDIGTSNLAFAAVQRKGSARSRLLAVNLTNGAATAAAKKPELPTRRVRALAAAGAVGDDKRAAKVTLRTKRAGAIVRLTVRCDEACTFTVNGRRGEVRGRAGTDVVRVAAKRGSRLSVSVLDAAGNKRVARTRV